MSTSSANRSSKVTVFDVFLCHNASDKPAVKVIGKQLEARGLRVWLDEWELRPGLSWQEKLEEQIEQIGAAAVFVGRMGLGPWQKRELRGFLSQFVKRECPVIPVLLADCPEPPPEIPVFLGDLTWVDFRKPDPDPLEQLVWGITGDKPNRPAPRYPTPEIRDLSQGLKEAYRQRAELEARGDDTTVLTETVLDLRRKIREGGQLKAGDLLLDGRIELLEPIGRGGFAQVWKAYDESERAVVAVKVLHGQYAEDRTRRERFFRGARHMARLHHPGIVRVVEEKCEDGGYHFFIMELASGGDLRQAVLAGRLNRQERLRIILEVGEALAFAHERGVIHRDVKPGNILLDGNDHPKLTDFDLVRAAGTTGGTRTTMLGTFLYAAPEAMVDAKQAAVPADVYGLGMTAIFALHGADLAADVLWELPELVAEIEVEEGCRRALLRAVARKVENRWTTVSELCQALRAGMDGKAPEKKRRRKRTVAAPELFRTVDAPHDGRLELWRKIPAGEGWIGSPESEEGRHDHEGPRHRVTIVRPFRMAAVPVTNAQYAAFDPGQADANSPDHPVVNVSWDNAMSFCRWLASHVPGCAGARLPTEEEWEYACRAGTETRFWSGDSEEALAEVGWYDKNSGGDLHRVAEKRANPWGLYDMHGNVREWTTSKWKPNYSGREEGITVDPSVEPADLVAYSFGEWRVFRGGGFRGTVGEARAACRDGDVTWFEFGVRGFRVVLPAAPSGSPAELSAIC